MENKNEKIEKRTLERLLKDLREQKNWTYNNVVSELSKVGLNVNEKTVKKWEYGLIYPDINEIYKLSEVYHIFSQDIINAKNNSFQTGMNSIHITFIKWFCYLLNVSFWFGSVLVIAFYIFSFIFALNFFVSIARQVKR